MFKGLRGGTVPVYKSLKKGENLSMEEEKEWETNDDERRQKFDEDTFWRSQYEDQLNGFILDKAQQDEVDRRYSTIQWPARFTNKYLPMQDTECFTSADCLHFVIYAGIDNILYYSTTL